MIVGPVSPSHCQATVPICSVPLLSGGGEIDVKNPVPVTFAAVVSPVRSGKVIVHVPVGLGSDALRPVVIHLNVAVLSPLSAKSSGIDSWWPEVASVETLTLPTVIALGVISITSSAAVIAVVPLNSASVSVAPLPVSPVSAI